MKETTIFDSTKTIIIHYLTSASVHVVVSVSLVIHPRVVSSSSASFDTQGHHVLFALVVAIALLICKIRIDLRSLLQAECCRMDSLIKKLNGNVPKKVDYADNTTILVGESFKRGPRDRFQEALKRQKE